MKHQITLSEVLDYLRDGQKLEVVGSYGKGSHKSLVATSYFDERPAIYTVEVSKKELLRTDDLTDAIKLYNQYP